MGHKPNSFADAVVLGAKEASDHNRPYLLADLARALPSAKRISYDSSMRELIERSKVIPTEEIFAQFDKVVLPFRTLWIEKRATTAEFEQSKGVGRVELGFLVKADAIPGSFSFQTFASTKFEAGYNPKLGMDGLEFTRQIYGRAKSLRNVTLPYEIEFAADREMHRSTRSQVHVNPVTGITFDESVLIADIEETDKKKHSPKFKPENLINALYDEADFLLRVFTVLSSPRLVREHSLVRLPKDVEDENYDRLRMKKGRVPLVPVLPIIIDISAAANATLENGDVKQVRQLLGWTSVRAHTMLVNGKIYPQKAHDRKIEAAVDRRDVERQLTNSNDSLRLEIKGGRPIRSLANPEQ